MILAVLLATAMVCLPVRLPPARMSADRRRETDDIEFGELVGLGLASGMTFEASARAAAPLVGGTLAARVSRWMRDPSSSPPEPLARLLATVRTSVVSGAPVLAAVDAYVAARRAEERTRALVAVRKLPVKLLFPLALLILPGFMLLTVGPVVAGAIARLGT